MDRLYRYDTIVISGFILFLWVILGVVLIQVVSLLDENSVRAISISSAITVGVFSTASLVAVLVHLKQKNSAIYGEDVDNLLLRKSAGSVLESLSGAEKANVLLETEG